MSNIRLFFSETLSANMTGKLDKSQSHYVNKVMRIKENEIFSLFNSEGEWEAKILNISRSIVEFKLIKQLRQKENIKELWLAFSPIKSNYQNFMIQKATELGVTKFLPIIFDRTIVRKINQDRLEKVITEASEQSNRLKVPKLEKILKLDDFLTYNQNTNIIFGDLNSSNTKLNIENNEPLCILVGPEGDFTVKEREKILQFNNIISLNINKNILRSETAAISMISIVTFDFLS
tara:strand:- start:894 stop:1595 length:702 start_codon:yes stop_codon:yes gene_type:complete